MATATEKKPAATKPLYYPTLTTLVDDNPPIEGELVYEVKDATGRSYFVKAISPAQAALTIVDVHRISQKSILYALSQAILERKANGDN